MVDNFPAYVEAVLLLEGGPTYTNNPADDGGPTKFGITAATAIAAGYTGSIAGMTKALAVSIYRTIYWLRPGFDLVDPILPPLAAYLFNIGVNRGPKVPVQLLQRTLNAFGNGGATYQKLLVDGSCGPVTRGVITAYLDHRPASENGAAVLLGTLRSLVAADYVAIVETNSTVAEFAYGWLRDRALGLPD
jgi:lysozyme family protein